MRKVEVVECDHLGFDRSEVHHEGGSYCGTTRHRSINICSNCGTVYLERYAYYSAQGEEVLEMLEPGETVDGVTFYKGIASLVKQVRDCSSQVDLKQITWQVQAIVAYAEKRALQLQEQEETSNAENV